ncbi:MAG TPA: DUF4019 domain-containing protein [Casimicrobiaceae bacterium]|nr:DUF4019 domain-containing protein [Casimicrobiaceae bacterium]
MIARATVGRRAVLCALGLLALGSATASLAQDPRAAQVQSAARDWLNLTDKLNATASFNAAGARFREPINLEQWTDALTKARAPLGAVDQRTVAETAFDKAAGDGGTEFEIAMVRFRTAFAKKTESSETVTLEHEADGNWRVIGYFIR